MPSARAIVAGDTRSGKAIAVAMNPAALANFRVPMDRGLPPLKTGFPGRASISRVLLESHSMPRQNEQAGSSSTLALPADLVVWRPEQEAAARVAR